ncbi:MAG: DUF1573 domain-containing protein [Candidatus Roizmanbacteria bacterium]|nr:MAG: DUF1573 domain-containing protein [Candidatus Roizmanbacteria bacterium]
MKGLIAGITIFSVIIIVGSYFIFSSGNKPVNLLTYTAADKEKPQVQVKKTSFDLGNMKVSDEKSNDFIIKNTGSKPLQISKITTSCSCTFAKIIYDGKESKEFNMHSKDSYIAEIAPNKEAKLKVIYRPYIMPVYGQVEREAYLSTNDPQNPKLVFKIKAQVK